MRIVQFLKRPRIMQLISYGFWGVVTTAVNVVCYWLCRQVDIPVVPATIISWFVSVLFAYVTNRRYVFHSQLTSIKQVMAECFSFFASRFFSGVLDVLLMYLTIEVLLFPELISKIGVEVFISLLNYFLSIFIVFNKKIIGKVSPH